MKNLTICVLFACLYLASCKLDNLNPDQTKAMELADSVKRSPQDPNTRANVAGVWTWSAQYDAGAYEGDLLDPANTGIHEILTLNADSTWSQAKNGSVVNTGTYKLVNVYTPDGPRIFLKIINSTQPNAQTYDNFDFNTGFGGSYACSSDSLIFYGVYTTPQYTNLATERIYLK